MNKILTGTDKANEEGFKDYLERLAFLPMRRPGGDKSKLWDGTTTKEDPVEARIDHGRWIADCDQCGGAEYVDPDNPLFYCFSCRNKAHKGAARPVIFPVNREEIDAALLERKVIEHGGDTETEKALRHVSVGLPRSWTPGETPLDLREQQKHILKAKALVLKGKL
jgi:hypothetical protein